MRRPHYVLLIDAGVRGNQFECREADFKMRYVFIGFTWPIERRRYKLTTPRIVLFSVSIEEISPVNELYIHDTAASRCASGTFEWC